MHYVSLQKSQLLDSLENQVLYADLCCLIIAPEGYGKSYFLTQLHARMEGQVNLSQIEALPEMTVDQLEKSVSLQLGLSWQQSDDLIERASNRFDRRALITIDDAHLLTASCLEYLMKIVADQLEARETKVFLVLSGDARLAKKLNQTSALKSNPNICVVFELQPIEQSETKHLVAAFQSIDVGTAEALYDEQKFEYFWQLAKGVPGDIEYQIKRWLSEAAVKKDVIPARQIKRKYGLAAMYTLIAFSLLLVLFYQDEINRYIESSPSKKATLQTATLPELQSENAKTTLDADSSPAPQPDKIEPLLAESNEIVATSENQQKTEQKDLLEVQNPEPAETDRPLAEKSEIVDLKQSDTDADVEPTNQAIDLKDNKLAQSTESPKIDKADADPSETLADGALPLTKDELTLLDYSDKQYTLQWVGVSSLASAQSFRESHPLKPQMLIFRRKQGDKYLYLIVSGQFNSRIDAENALKVYKQRQYPGTAWIKPITAVRKEISTLQ